MNALILNGSPRKADSNTLKIAQAFIDGLQEKWQLDIETVHLYDQAIEINHCVGCFNCWTKTPGKCIFNDSMEAILQAIVKADLVIWAFPLYYFSLPSKAKACLDRQLPFNEPFMLEERAGHCQRYDFSNKKYIVISSGGLSTTENNFEALDKQFSLVFDNHGGNYTKLFVAQSPLLSIEQLEGKVSGYLAQVKMAGKEYANNFSLSKQTIDALEKPLYSIDVYNQLADASWEITKDDGAEETNKRRLLPFTKQMAALYSPENYEKDIVIEIEYSDYGECYQIVLEKDKASVLFDDFKQYNCKIETPYSVWEDISKGKLSGSGALMEGKYKVFGDLSVMINWDKLFGAADQDKPDPVALGKKSEAAKSNMSMMLVPWIALWVLPFGRAYSMLLVVAISLLLPLFFQKLKFTVYDKLSAFLASLFSLFSLFGLNGELLLPLSYLCFAGLWLGSLFTKKSLSSCYSSVNYGGEKAFENPIFMKTNTILTLCWGLLYIGIALFTVFAVRSVLQPYLVIINNVPPILLGIFTKYFQDWYPKKVMAGKNDFS